MNEMVSSLRDQLGIAGVEAGAPSKETSSLPDPVDAADFLNKVIKSPPELVKGLIHQGTKIVIGGGSKSHKTWTLLELAICVALGIPFWEFPTIPTVVLYLNFEIPDFAFQIRLRKLCEAFGRKAEDLRGKLLVWNLRGYAMSFDLLRIQITEKINKQKCGLMIVDPYYKVLGDRDENSAQAISALHNLFERVCVDTGAALAWGAHFAKGNAAGKNPIDRISGSGVFARDPDTIMTMTQNKTVGAYSVELTLRNFPPVEPFVVRWDHPLMVRDNKLNPADLYERKPGRGTPTQPEFMALFPETYGDDPRSGILNTNQLKQAFEDKGWKKDNIANIRDGLVKQGGLEMVVEHRNEKLVGRPDIIAEFRRRRNGGGTFSCPVVQNKGGTTS